MQSSSTEVQKLKIIWLFSFLQWMLLFHFTVCQEIVQFTASRHKEMSFIGKISKIVRSLKALKFFCWMSENWVSRIQKRLNLGIVQWIRKLYRKFEGFSFSIDWNIAESLMLKKNRDLESALLYHFRFGIPQDFSLSVP